MRGGYHIRISVAKPPEPDPNLPPSSFTSRSSPPHPRTPFVPTSLFEPLPSHPQKPPPRRNTFHYRHHSFNKADLASTVPFRDYRFGPLQVEWVDFEAQVKASEGGKISSVQGKKMSSGKEREAVKGGPPTATFTQVREKSGSTNLPEGVVHIYRSPPDAQSLRSHSSDPAHSSSPSVDELGSSSYHASQLDAPDSEAGVLLAVLAVPAWMTPSDFLAFVAPAADGISHLRMIRDSAPNRSIVIVGFRLEAGAAEFAEAFNGKQFNSLEPEICHVVRVLSVEIDVGEFPGQPISQFGFPPGTYELPTCPVCLERMDAAVTGLVTVPCSHTFHCACLSKWGDSRCPVCRYSQTLLSSHPTSANTSRSTVPIPFSSSSSSRCIDCDPDSPSTSNLWICLICGNIGCGRYRRAHAHAHYERTTHLYALELETQRVWDYAGDGYVHRLIQNKADGKLVELPSAASSLVFNGSARGDGGGPSAADALSAEKIEAIGIEYSYLLTSQLDSQRTFYEEQMAGWKSQIESLSGLVQALTTELEFTKGALQQQQEQQIAESEKARIKAEQKAERATELNRALDKELKSERALSEGLMKNLGVLKDRAEKAEQEREELKLKVGELEDQVRDVMFFLEAKEKIEVGGGLIGEAAGGSVGVTPTTTSKRKGKKGK